LPDLSGVEVCRRIRAASDVPIVVLSARGSERDKVEALDAGADDYVTKPFSPRELIARVRAVLRRTAAGGDQRDVFQFGDLTVDVTQQTVRRDGTSVDLTPTEFQLLAALARRPGRIFTRTQLLDAVRGTDVESFDRAIDTHIKNIRRKIERDPRDPRYILTVYGVGYRSGEP